MKEEELQEFIDNMYRVELSEDCDDIDLDTLRKWIRNYKTISYLDESDKEELTNTIISVMNSKWLSYPDKLLFIREITCQVTIEFIKEAI
jgi:endogenous inhibitor of DNA gyrase (YacG/DUF329 family)